MNFKHIKEAFKSVVKIADAAMVIIGAGTIFGISLLISDIPTWIPALVGAVAYIAGFAIGCERTNDSNQITIEKGVRIAEAQEIARIKTLDELKRKREIEEAEKVESENKDKKTKLFRESIKRMNFDDKLLLTSIFLCKRIEINDIDFQESQHPDVCCIADIDDNERFISGINDRLHGLQSRKFIEYETLPIKKAWMVEKDIDELLRENIDLIEKFFSNATAQIAVIDSAVKQIDEKAYE